MSESGEFYAADKNFTLPLAVTAWTNITSTTPYYVNSVGYDYSKNANIDIAHQVLLPHKTHRWLD